VAVAAQKAMMIAAKVTVFVEVVVGDILHTAQLAISPYYTHPPLWLRPRSPDQQHALLGLSLYLRLASKAYDLWRHRRRPSLGIVAGRPLISDLPEDYPCTHARDWFGFPVFVL